MHKTCLYTISLNKYVIPESVCKYAILINACKQTILRMYGLCVKTKVNYALKGKYAYITDKYFLKYFLKSVILR